MTTSCKVEGAIIQVSLQSNAVSLLCITYELYSALKLTNASEDASIRFKRYIKAMAFSLISVLTYLVIANPTDGHIRNGIFSEHELGQLFESTLQFLLDIF